MNLSDKEIEHIIMLAKSEKPVKYIRQYLQPADKTERQIAFFNKSSNAFFTYYFKSFAGRYSEECALEAYARALELLRGGADLDVALQAGMKRGNKYFHENSRDAVLEYNDELEGDDEYFQNY